jgi:transglutaminase-like putative cysteine protease
VTTAWGRDYADVSPLKGIVFGGGDSHMLDVSVDVTRSLAAERTAG